MAAMNGLQHVPRIPWKPVISSMPLFPRRSVLQKGHGHDTHLRRGRLASRLNRKYQAHGLIGSLLISSRHCRFANPVQVRSASRQAHSVRAGDSLPRRYLWTDLWGATAGLLRGLTYIWAVETSASKLPTAPLPASRVTSSRQI